MSSVEQILIWSDALLSLMFISSVWKDSMFSKAAQNIAVGAAVANGVLIAINTIYTTGIITLLGGDILVLAGLIMGVLMFARLTPYKWASRYPTQLLMCVGLGTMFGLSINSTLFGQITATADTLIHPASSWDLFSGILIVVGAVSTLAYFLFTFPPFATKQRGIGRTPYGVVTRIARIFMMAAFGMTFVTEETGYLTIFIGRLSVLFRTALGLG